MAIDDTEIDQRVSEAEASLAAIEACADPAARDSAVGAVQALVGIYGIALERLLTRAYREGGLELVSALAEDKLVAHLLLVHDLHPLEVETRVRHALESVRPYLESHGGSVELLRLDDGYAHLRMHGSCRDCPSSSATLENVIEQAIREQAPELLGIKTEQLVAAPAGFVPLGDLG